MLKVVIALDCEAKPLREHWRLKPVPANGFRVYANDHTRLIISGPGILNAAAATAYLAGQDAFNTTTAWLNLGVAGHASLPLGTPVLASGIQQDQQRWYPSLVFHPPCTLKTILTVSRPETNYPGDQIYEMEAAGFYPTASRFASAELVQVLKIISDNREHGIQQLNAPGLSALVAAALPLIDGLCDELRQLATELSTLEADPPGYQAYLQRWHFSASQRVQLRRLLQRHQMLLGDPPILSSLTSPRAVLRTLQHALEPLAPCIVNLRKDPDL